jgi:hypothetical protein
VVGHRIRSFPVVLPIGAFGEALSAASAVVAVVPATQDDNRPRAVLTVEGGPPWRVDDELDMVNRLSSSGCRDAGFSSVSRWW